MSQNLLPRTTRTTNTGWTCWNGKWNVWARRATANCGAMPFRARGAGKRAGERCSRPLAGVIADICKKEALMPAVLDRRFLDGEFLAPEEALEKYRATKIEPLHDLYRLYDHESFKDFERRRGLVLHSSEFIYRVCGLNRQIVVQRQINFEDEWGFYVDTCGKLVYLSGFHQGWLTEFSYSLVDHRNIPTEERRGWRTVLLRLMGRGVLSWEQAIREFGNSDGLNSERWMVYSAPYRNRNGAWCVARNLANEMETY
jgi:hypothetical protein